MVSYEVTLSQKGRFLVDAWKSGDREVIVISITLACCREQLSKVGRIVNRSSIDMLALVERMSVVLRGGSHG